MTRTVVVLADRADHGAAAIARELAARPGAGRVLLLGPTDLLRARWSHRTDAAGRPRTTLTLPGGERLTDDGIGAVLHRLTHLPLPPTRTGRAPEAAPGAAHRPGPSGPGARAAPGDEGPAGASARGDLGGHPPGTGGPADARTGAPTGRSCGHPAPTVPTTPLPLPGTPAPDGASPSAPGGGCTGTTAKDRDYARAERYALLAAWLLGLGSRVLGPVHACGTAPGPLSAATALALAEHLGLPVARTGRATRAGLLGAGPGEVLVPELAWPGGPAAPVPAEVHPAPGPSTRLLLCGTGLTGGETPYGPQLRLLAGRLGTTLLELRLAPGGLLTGIDLLPPLALRAHRTAVADWLHGTAAAGPAATVTPATGDAARRSAPGAGPASVSARAPEAVR